MKKLPEGWIKLLKNHYNSTENLNILELHGGGSQRQYFRIQGEGKKFILCSSEKEVEEQIEIGLFLGKNNIPVPNIYDYNKKDGLILFEDGGTLSLQNKINNLKGKEEELLKIYKEVIDWLIKLQELNPQNCPSIKNRIFDHSYYRWETSYFLESCAGKVFNLEIQQKDSLIKEFDYLAETLSREETVIVHRDFQSQNIYIGEDRLYFLDFQSARLGVCQYDMASLSYDPYVCLPGDLRKDLLEYYITKKHIKNRHHFTDIFYKTSMQRLMQALGAYGFLGLVKGKKDFLKYIEPALKLLLDATKHADKYPEIINLTNQLLAMNYKLSKYNYPADS
ncbi:MAG TPA: phosphotransferase [Candidatus Eremiobacteraeota bacterium]|nr:MAG: Phosphotransferase enzyme family protein [bacterium ADurb.Bin363]HPZ09030.1 phosphotransferase [Candidatus Eremiobacteraeota bacterium]